PPLLCAEAAGALPLAMAAWVDWASAPEAAEVSAPGVVEVSAPEAPEVSMPGVVDVFPPGVVDVSPPEGVDVSPPGVADVSPPGDCCCFCAMACWIAVTFSLAASRLCLAVDRAALALLRLSWYWLY